MDCSLPGSSLHGILNGNPPQCSCLENPRDEGAWWAAIYGVAQSRTRLKRLSSSSSCLKALSHKLDISLLLLFSHSVMSNSLWPHRLQHTRLPCPSPSPGACSNSCPSSHWCHPTISSSIVLFSSCLQSFPASGSFPLSQFFTSGGQSVGDWASKSVLPMNIQVWFPLGLTALISLQFKGISRFISNATITKHQFYGTQLSLWSKSHIHTWPLEKP